MVKSVFLIFLLFLNSQDYEKQLAALNETYQNCLDEGKIMVNCSRDFLTQATELMNLILEDYQKTASKRKFSRFLLNQKNWEVEKNKKFEKINSQLDSVQEVHGMIPMDELMFARNDRARIIEDRINQLILFLK